MTREGEGAIGSVSEREKSEKRGCALCLKAMDVGGWSVGPLESGPERQKEEPLPAAE